MRNERTSIILGALLVVIGLAFLAQNLGLFGGLENVIWVVLFGIGGLGFLYVFATNREQWWAIIPGFTLLGIAGLIGFGERLGALGGAFFLGSIGLAFWVIYVLRRDFWWAIIPAGVLTTLAVVAAIADTMDGDGMAVGGFFFLGLAATFALVYLLPNPEERMKWALIPAGILGVMGLLMILSLGGLINYIVPAALILSGPRPGRPRADQAGLIPAPYMAHL